LQILWNLKSHQSKISNQKSAISQSGARFELVTDDASEDVGWRPFAALHIKRQRTGSNQPDNFDLPPTCLIALCHVADGPAKSVLKQYRTSDIGQVTRERGIADVFGSSRTRSRHRHPRLWTV
jgi:hypothetical protein